MKKSKIFPLSASLLCAFGLAACGESQGGDKSAGGNNNNDVAGTYSVLYDKSDISGNVRHTGYVTSRENAFEKNTIVLGQNGEYEYTKLLSDDVTLKDESQSPKTAIARAAEVQSESFLVWTSVEADGSSLEFMADGTFKAVAKAGAYELKANGTFEWKNWSLKIVTEAGAEATGTMDSTTHALTIQVDFGHGVLSSFTAESTAWGTAFGTTGTYTPVASESTKDVTYFYQGSGQKQGGGVTYDATIKAFFLKDGRAYIVEETSTNSIKQQGAWTESNGIITLTLGSETFTSASDGFTIAGIKTTLQAELPADYENANWDELFEALNVKYSEHITIIYTFKGKYIASGNEVTLKTPTALSWSEDWGLFQKHGFTNTTGQDLDGKVYPKGTTGTYCYAIDHFNTNDFVMAPSDPTEVTGANDVNVILDKANQTYSYNNKSIFDE